MSKWDMESFRQSKQYPWVVLALLGVGAFMVNLDTSSVNVALNYIAEDYDSDITVVQWIATAYILAVVSSVAIIGRLGDLYGRTRVYSIGFIVFIIGSFLCTLAPNIQWLIAFRVLQALGGACVPANNMGILTGIFPSHLRGRALGILSSLVAMGALTGPSVGGLLIGLYGWRSIFLLNVPIGLAAAVLFYIVLPSKKIEAARPAFDYLGSVLFIVAAVGGIWSLSSFSNERFNPAQIGLVLIISIVALAAFIWHEKRISFPVIDPAIFRINTFRFGVMAMMCSQMLLFMVNLLTPFYLAQILRFTPSMVGIAMSPIPILLAVTAPLSGWLSDRIGYNIPSLTGLTLVGLGMFSLSLLEPDASIFDVSWRLALLAFGHGVFNSPNNSAMMGSVPRQHLGVAGSTIAVMRKTGQVLGVAVGVILFDFRRSALLGSAVAASPELQEEAFMAGFSFAYQVGIFVALLAMFTAFVRRADLEKEKEVMRQEQQT